MAMTGPPMDEGAYCTYSHWPSPRVRVPRQITNGSASKLQRCLINAWRNSEPTLERKLAIAEILNRLTFLVNSAAHDGNERRDRYRVDVFGSVSWGGETSAHSDLDLVIIGSHIPQGYVPSLWRLGPSDETKNVPQQNDKVPAVYHMNILAKIMRRTEFRVRKVVGRAATPIIKFSVWTGARDIDCDITMNDLGGWYNSQLILAYCNFMPYVLRPMLFALKKWLAACGLNDPAAEKGRMSSMSSYCLTLMAIACLQHFGLLPNLQENIEVPERSDPGDESLPGVVWISWGRPQGKVAHISFSKTAPEGWVPVHSDVDAAQALALFFRLYRRPSARDQTGDTFNPAHEYISVVNGGLCQRPWPKGAFAKARNDHRNVLEKQGLSAKDIATQLSEWDNKLAVDELAMGTGLRDIMPRRWDEKLLVVQDPFVWEKNCASGMSKAAVDRFFKAVTATDALLQSENPTWDSVLRLARTFNV